MESIFGLPIHPLAVHAPVVLMPLTLLLAFALAARSSWRDKAGWTLVVAAGATFVSALAAKLSGEAFDEALNENFFIDRSTHQDLANTTVVLLLVFLLLTIAMVGFGWWAKRQEVLPGWTGTASMVILSLVLLVGVLGTIWMIRTGHEGAKLVHEGKI